MAARTGGSDNNNEEETSPSSATSSVTDDLETPSKLRELSCSSSGISGMSISANVKEMIRFLGIENVCSGSF